MSTRLLLEGPDLEELLAKIKEEHGAAARIVSAERVRTGGLAGFFAKQRFEIAVDILDPDEAGASSDEDVPPTADGLAALLARAEAQERELDESERAPRTAARFAQVLAERESSRAPRAALPSAGVFQGLADATPEADGPGSLAGRPGASGVHGVAPGERAGASARRSSAPGHRTPSEVPAGRVSERATAEASAAETGHRTPAEFLTTRSIRRAPSDTPAAPRSPAGVPAAQTGAAGAGVPAAQSRTADAGVPAAQSRTAAQSRAAAQARAATQGGAASMAEANAQSATAAQAGAAAQGWAAAQSGVASMAEAAGADAMARAAAQAGAASHAEADAQGRADAMAGADVQAGADAMAARSGERALAEQPAGAAGYRRSAVPLAAQAGGRGSAESRSAVEDTGREHRPRAGRPGLVAGADDGWADDGWADDASGMRGDVGDEAAASSAARGGPGGGDGSGARTTSTGGARPMLSEPSVAAKLAERARRRAAELAAEAAANEERAAVRRNGRIRIVSGPGSEGPGADGTPAARATAAPERAAQNTPAVPPAEPAAHAATADRAAADPAAPHRAATDPAAADPAATHRAAPDPAAPHRAATDPAATGPAATDSDSTVVGRLHAAGSDATLPEHDHPPVEPDAYHRAAANGATTHVGDYPPDTAPEADGRYSAAQAQPGRDASGGRAAAHARPSADADDDRTTAYPRPGARPADGGHAAAYPQPGPDGGYPAAHLNGGSVVNGRRPAPAEHDAYDLDEPVTAEMQRPPRVTRQAPPAPPASSPKRVTGTATVTAPPNGTNPHPHGAHPNATHPNAAHPHSAHPNGTHPRPANGAPAATGRATVRPAPPDDPPTAAQPIQRMPPKPSTRNGYDHPAVQLVRNGVPVHIAARAVGPDPWTAVARAVAGLPYPPALPSRAGEVLVIVGDTDSALLVAGQIAALSASVDPSATLVAGSIAGTGLRRSHRISSPDEAIRRGLELHTAAGPRIVVVEATAGSPIGRAAAVTSSADGSPRAMIAALAPTQVWACVDATRKNADTARFLDALERVDALAVHGAGQTVEPGSVLHFGLPVVMLDGRPATARRWTTLLCERLTGGPLPGDGEGPIAPIMPLELPAGRRGAHAAIVEEPAGSRRTTHRAPEAVYLNGSEPGGH